MQSINLEKLEDLIIQLKDPRLSLLIVGEKITPRLNEHKQIIIDSNDAEWIYDLAKIYDNNKLEGIKDLEQAIIKTKAPEYLLKYAKTISSANLDLLEKELVLLNNPEISYLYTRDIENSNILLHKSVIDNCDNWILKNKFNNNLAKKIEEETTKNQEKKLTFK